MKLNGYASANGWHRASAADSPPPLAPLGVSIVICTHNGADRLPATLSHLAAQQVPRDINWEVVVIDNASTDNSADAAARSWPAGHPAPLRVIREPRLGAAYARQCGLDAARYEYASFVDDDNWVCPTWVQTAAAIMSQRHDIAACFGPKEGVCEVAPPSWFEAHKRSFVIGPDLHEPADFTNRPCEIPSAGLTVRRNAWMMLREAGFHLTALGHQGTRLTAGEDTELCCALRLSGWKLLYDPRLRLQHFVPRSRLDWSYLRRQSRGWGFSTAWLDPYYFALARADNRGAPAALLPRIKETWLWQTLATAKYLCLHPALLMRSFFRDHPGSPAELEIDGMFGRLVGLLSNPRRYRAAVHRVRVAPWGSGPVPAGAATIPTSPAAHPMGRV